MRKCDSGQMRTAKAQISLRMRAVWSRPSLSAYRITGYYIMYECRTKGWMMLCACARWSESAHFAHFRRPFFAWRDPIKPLSGNTISVSIFIMFLALILLWVCFVRPFVRYSLDTLYHVHMNFQKVFELVLWDLADLLSLKVNQLIHF